MVSVVLAKVPGKISECVMTSAFFPANRRLRKSKEGSERPFVERAALGENSPWRKIAGMEAVEQEHTAYGSRMARLPEDRPDRSVPRAERAENDPRKLRTA